jgi:hypothetical protein
MKIEPEFNPVDFRDILMKWIITTDQPFTTVQEQTFQDMISYANPLASYPRTGEGMKQCIVRSFEDYSTKLQVYFKVFYFHFIQGGVN